MTECREQFDTNDKDRTPFAVLVAPAELAEGKVGVKQQVDKEGPPGHSGVPPRVHVLRTAQYQLKVPQSRPGKSLLPK